MYTMFNDTAPDDMDLIILARLMFNVFFKDKMGFINIWNHPSSQIHLLVNWNASEVDVTDMNALMINCFILGAVLNIAHS